MSAIDVGPEAINRADNVNGNYTFLQKDNPANGTGKITSLEVFSAMTGAIKVGFFYLVSGTTYKCRSSVTLSSITSGAKRTITTDSSGNPINMDVTTGDLIAVYILSGAIECTTSLGGGAWWVSGDQMTVGASTAYASASGWALSVKGIGATTATETRDVASSDGGKFGDTASVAITVGSVAADGVALGEYVAALRNSFGGAVQSGMWGHAAWGLGLWGGGGPTVEVECTDGLAMADAPVSAVSPMPSASDGVVIGDALTSLVEPMPVSSDGLVMSETAPSTLLAICPAATTCMIDELAYPILEGSLGIDMMIEERSTASFIVIDLDAAWTFYEKQPVAIYKTLATGPLLFTGFIDSIVTNRLGATGGVFHSITCCDNHYCADKRLAAESYESQTAEYIVEDLLTKYLADEGVTEGSIQGSAVTIKELVVNYARVSESLDKLAELCNYIWWIDENKKLYFVDRSSIDAPWDYTYDASVGSPKLTTQNSAYRNRQYVKGTAITDAQTETFTADGVVKSWPCGYPLNNEPTITQDSVAATVGIKGLDTGYDFYWSKGDPIITTDTAPANGVAIAVTYYGQYPAVILSKDNAAITARATIEGSGTGYVDDIEDETGVTNIEALWQSGSAKLAKFCRDGRRYAYETQTAGLFPGQYQHITDTLLGRDQDMLIESVRLVRRAGTYTYSVSCIEGPEQGSWARLFKSLADQAKLVMDRINVGAGETMIVLSEAPDATEWEESVSETVYACPLCSASTKCGAATIVC